jgi:hypothetical protein
MTRTSNPPMKGMIVSFSSGLNGPIGVQNCVSPSLIALFCASEVVRLKSTASAFPSCGWIAFGRSLSRNNPAVASHKIALYAALMDVALARYADAREVSPSCVARSEAVIRV